VIFAAIRDPETTTSPFLVSHLVIPKDIAFKRGKTVSGWQMTSCKLSRRSVAPAPRYLSQVSATHTKKDRKNYGRLISHKSYTSVAMVDNNQESRKSVHWNP